MQKKGHTERVYNTFGDAVGGAKFYPDHPHVPLDKILNVQVLIRDAVVIKQFKGKYGRSDFALMLFVDPETGEEATTLCGGMVVVEKMEKAIEGKFLPLMGTIEKLVSDDNDNEYYVIS